MSRRATPSAARSGVPRTGGGIALSDAAVRCRRPALDRAITRRVYSAASAVVSGNIPIARW